MRVIDGHITILEEERFRLLTKDGRGLLFTLAHNAGSDATQLAHYRDARTRVQVAYEGEPDLASGVARAVSRLS